MTAGWEGVAARQSAFVWSLGSKPQYYLSHNKASVLWQLLRRVYVLHLGGPTLQSFMVVLGHSVQYCSNNYVNHILITSAEQLFYVLYYRFVNKKVLLSQIYSEIYTLR